MRFTFRLLTATAAFAALLGSANAAPITIDNFTSPSPRVIANGPSSFAPLNVGTPTLPMTSQSVSGSTILGLGDFAAIGANHTYPGSVGLLPGSFAVFTGTNAIESTLAYTVTGASQNFAGTSGIALSFAYVDAGLLSSVLSITIDITSSTGTSSALVFVPETGSPTTVFAGYGAFSGTIDLSSVSLITLRLNDGGNPVSGLDFVLTNVTAFENAPEPASMVVFRVLAPAGWPSLVVRCSPNVPPPPED